MLKIGGQNHHHILRMSASCGRNNLIDCSITNDIYVCPHIIPEYPFEFHGFRYTLVMIYLAIKWSFSMAMLNYHLEVHFPL